jgi:hypothetical protein
VYIRAQSKASAASTITPDLLDSLVSFWLQAPPLELAESCSLFKRKTEKKKINGTLRCMINGIINKVHYLSEN